VVCVVVETRRSFVQSMLETALAGLWLGVVMRVRCTFLVVGLVFFFGRWISSWIYELFGS
jgi:hypothetical protein